MTKKSVSGTAIVLILLMLGFGCDSASEASHSKSGTVKFAAVSAPEPSGPLDMTDMLGRVVVVNCPVRRIVVDSWDTVDVLVAAAGESIMKKIVGVGRTKDCHLIQALYAEDYPRLKDLPGIGGGRGAMYDPEMIIALRPDVLIFNSMGAFLDRTMETVAAVEKVGIPSVILTIASEPVSGTRRALEIAGRLFGTKERAKEAADFIDHQYARIAEKQLSQQVNKPTVYWEKGSGSSEEYDITVTSGGWANIIALAGGNNIARGTVGNNTMIAPEYLISRDPDFIIIGGSLGYGRDKSLGTRLIDDYADRTGWEKLSAVRENRIYELPHGASKGHMCFYPTLFLAKLFYPEICSDIHPQAVLREYFHRFMLLDFDEGVWIAHREALTNE